MVDDMEPQDYKGKTVYAKTNATADTGTIEKVMAPDHPENIYTSDAWRILITYGGNIGREGESLERLKNGESKYWSLEEQD